MHWRGLQWLAQDSLDLLQLRVDGQVHVLVVANVHHKPADDAWVDLGMHMSTGL